MEVDISEKVVRWLKIGLLCFVLLTVGIAGVSYFYHNEGRYITVSNAKVSGALINAPVRTAGTIVEMLVEEGQTVEAGQPLAKVQVEVSPEQLKQLQEAVLAAELRYKELQTRPAVFASASVQASGAVSGGDLAGAQAGLERARRDKEKMDNLFAIGGISAVQHNAANAAYAAALDAYEAAQAVPAPVAPQELAVFGTAGSAGDMLKIAQQQIQQSKQALAAVTEQQQYVQIESAVDGTVYFNGVNVGDKVSPGQVVFKVGDVHEVWVEAKVPIANKDQISLGQFVKYQIADYSKEKLSGTVYEILDNENETEATSVIVRISVPTDVQANVKPGMNVLAKISV